MLSSEDSTFLYTGPSMLPTFHPGDEMQLEERGITTLRRGDVVVFEQSKAEEMITVVHRIVANRHNQWLMRGDNNLHLDPEPLSEETFIGIVVSHQRQGHARSVLNGFSGWLCATFLFATKWSWNRFKHIFQPLYALLRVAHLAHPAWKPTFTSLTIHTDEYGTLVKTLYRSRTVARYWVHTGAWHCQKPFDLVLSRPEHQIPPACSDEANPKSV